MLENVNTMMELSNIWHGCLKACVYISGMSIGEGFYFILPEQPNI